MFTQELPQVFQWKSVSMQYWLAGSEHGFAYGSMVTKEFARTVPLAPSASSRGENDSTRSISTCSRSFFMVSSWNG